MTALVSLGLNANTEIEALGPIRNLKGILPKLVKGQSDIAARAGRGHARTEGDDNVFH